MTSKDEISAWLKEGIRDGKTHVIVVCDTYDRSHYPVYVDATEDVHEVANRFNGINTQRIIEVYKLSLSIVDQLDEVRAFHY